jgi:hypothetical protein
MAHLEIYLANQLKKHGFKQPLIPSVGSVWYDAGGFTYTVLFSDDICSKFELSSIRVGEPTLFTFERQEFEELTFAPTFEDLARRLPDSCVFYLWAGVPTATKTADIHEKPIREQGLNFRAAAAKLWLKIKTGSNNPL